MLEPIFVERVRNFYSASIDRIVSAQSLLIEGYSDVYSELSTVKSALESAAPTLESILNSDEIPAFYPDGIPRFESSTGELQKDLWQAFDYLQFIDSFLSWVGEKFSLSEDVVVADLDSLGSVVSQALDVVVSSLSTIDG